jgi:rubrerythrin
LFGLPQVAQYRAASMAVRQAVLDECAGALLAESWHIEKSGVVFCARMTLAAEEEDERRVFALIGGQEATHSAWIEPWIQDRCASADPFNRFIAELVESGRPQPLAYLLQVVLEGFGIAHYANLAARCHDPALAAVLKRMAEDEASHHAAGLAAFRAARMSAAERQFAADGAYRFLQMIRSGPQRVVAVLAKRLDIHGHAAIAGLFSALDAEADTAAKLMHLKRLMARPGMEAVVDELERKGAFTPCTPVECTALYAGAS